MATTPLELTFKKYPPSRPGGRWLKKIHGKARYFGTGRSRSGLKSYRAARDACHRFRDQELASQQVHRMARAFFRGKREADQEEIDEGRVLTPGDLGSGAADHWESHAFEPRPTSTSRAWTR